MIFFPLSDKDISHGLCTQLQFHLGDRCKLTRLYVKRSCSQRCRSRRRCRGEQNQKETGGRISGNQESCNYSCQSAAFGRERRCSLVMWAGCLLCWSQFIKLASIIIIYNENNNRWKHLKWALKLCKQVVWNCSFSAEFQILTILRFLLKDREHCLGNSRELHLLKWMKTEQTT